MNRFLLIFLAFYITSAQEKGNLHGKIANENLPYLQGIEVFFDQTSVYTNEMGEFKFNAIDLGLYNIFVEYNFNIYGPYSVEINSSETEFMEIYIDENEEIVSLEKVLLETKSESEILKNNAIKADIVTIEERIERASSVEEIINRTPGVKIRSVGGLGAIDNIVIGGFTGNSIKFLYDDIPIDYLGSNYGLNKIPTNLLNRIEIYKGVLPTKIGTDALGSAVNFIPNTKNKTYGSITYETGSYGTHIASINANIKIHDHLHIGTNTFYNHSKNNFKVDNLPYRNPETGQTEYIRAKLFHNAFEQTSYEFYIQSKNRKWADLLEFKVNSYYLTKEIQNDPYSRNRAFGEVYRSERGSYIPSLKYKNYFFDNKLNLNQFLVYSEIDFELFDLAKNKYYDWKGQVHTTNSGSEMGNLQMKDGYMLQTLKQFTSRTNLNYFINPNFQIESNTIFSYFNQKSSLDAFNPNGTDYNKLIVNLGVNSRFFDRKLESNSQVKYLYSLLSGNYNSSIDPNFIEINQKDIKSNGLSFSQAIKFNINAKNFVRASYENTYRLPEQNELFGDHNFIVSNYHLKPEKSHNLNLGYVFDSKTLRFEVNGYFRKIKDLIRLKSLNQYQAIFLNLDHVKGVGIELEAVYRPTNNFVMLGNLTWNDYRLESSNDQMLNNQHYKNARVSNMPFYFTNLSFTYNLKDILNLSTDLSVFYDYSYVHQYYLDFIEKQFEPDGFLGLWGTSKIHTNRIIPVQHLHSLGFVYTRDLGENNISLSAEIKNLLNYKIYNEFKMQSPGRNFRLKLTYTF